MFAKNISLIALGPLVGEGEGVVETVEYNALDSIVIMIKSSYFLI